MQRDIERVIRWLLFGAFFSVVPLIVLYLILLMLSQKPTLAKLVEHGELFVIVWVLSASALGELMDSNASNLAKTIFSFFTLAIVTAAASFFGGYVTAKLYPNLLSLDEHLVMSGSIALFFISLVPSSMCIFCVK